MKGRFLVTTADERTWPKDKPIVFLGEWCRLYNRKHVWENLDSVVVQYHWNDRKKLYNDYHYLQKLYEDELLIEVSEKLNEIHGVNHSLRYWRILIGPWLGYFIQILFDRYEMIQRAISDYSIYETCIIEDDPYNNIPNDMLNFINRFVSDTWNQAIYDFIIVRETDLSLLKIKLNDASNNHGFQAQSFKRKIIASGAKLTVKCFELFTRPDEAFLISDYLPKKESFRLQRRLGQIPKFWRTIAPPQFFAEDAMRTWELKDHAGNKFEKILRKFIPLQMPLVYLEGYKTLQNILEKLPWPGRSKLLFTCNAHNADDIFKAWAGEKTESGSSLIIGQHGGHYGIVSWSFAEDHEIKISDKYLTWGWDNKKNINVYPGYNVKFSGKENTSWNPKGTGLLVTNALPRYSYFMYSHAVSSQWLDYYEDQCRFINALPEKIQNQFLVRLYSQDYGWSQKQRWLDRFSNILLDSGEKSMVELIKDSRLYISTYNATTFLESMSLNIPTIIFWNPNHWELRESAVAYFNELKATGIFHETPESAARKVSEIWEDVYDWWYSDEIQISRKKFCDRYSRVSERMTDKLEGIFKQFIN